MRVCIPESIIADKISRIKSINKEARDIYDLKYLYESDVNPVHIEKEFRKIIFTALELKICWMKLKAGNLRRSGKKLGTRCKICPILMSI